MYACVLPGGCLGREERARAWVWGLFLEKPGLRAATSATGKKGWWVGRLGLSPALRSFPQG